MTAMANYVFSEISFLITRGNKAYTTNTVTPFFSKERI